MRSVNSRFPYMVAKRSCLKENSRKMTLIGDGEKLAGPRWENYSKASKNLVGDNYNAIPSGSAASLTSIRSLSGKDGYP